MPDGECCPECVPEDPNCSTVICLKPDCKDGEQLVVPAGECCPQCHMKCAVEDCPAKSGVL